MFLNNCVYYSCSPLHVAVGACRPVRQDINLLIEHGADVFLVTGDDMDVMDLSLHNKRIHQMMKKRQKEQASKGVNMTNGNASNIVTNSCLPVTTIA